MTYYMRIQNVSSKTGEDGDDNSLYPIAILM